VILCRTPNETQRVITPYESQFFHFRRPHSPPDCHSLSKRVAQGVGQRLSHRHQRYRKRQQDSKENNLTNLTQKLYFLFQKCKSRAEIQQLLAACQVNNSDKS
jgi:hypothetical protein